MNLFDRAESDVRPRRANEEGRVSIRIGYEEIAARTDWEPARFEVWKILLALALGVALWEWYIYNRRVYM